MGPMFLVTLKKEKRKKHTYHIFIVCVAYHYYSFNGCGVYLPDIRLRACRGREEKRIEEASKETGFGAVP